MPPSRRQTFENTLSGAQPPPLLPPLNHDPPPNAPPSPSLQTFRDSEGKHAREARLRALWRALPANTTQRAPPSPSGTPSKRDASPEAERARKMREIYEHELLSRMGRPHGDSKPVDWTDFLTYANEKEAELWRIFHHELDLVSPLPPIYTPPRLHVFPDACLLAGWKDRNGRLDANELRAALAKAGMSPSFSFHPEASANVRFFFLFFSLHSIHGQASNSTRRR